MFRIIKNALPIFVWGLITLHPSFADSKLTLYHANAVKIDFYALARPSFLKIHGTARTLEGTIQRKGEQISGKFHLKLDDFSTGIRMRDSDLKHKVFEIEKYPGAELTFEPFPVASGEKTKFSGVLKLHGVEREIQGEKTISFADNQVKFDCTFHILLTDFNIKPPEFLGMLVQNEVRVEVSGVGTK